jgi:hypothetical protein
VQYSSEVVSDELEGALETGRSAGTLRYTEGSPRVPSWSGGTGRRTGLKIPRPSLGMWVRPPPPAPTQPALRAARVLAFFLMAARLQILAL